MDDRERCLAKADDEGPTLLQGDGAGALDQGSRRAGGEGAEGAGAARYDGGAGQAVGARGDGRVELAVAVDDDLRARLLLEPGGRHQVGGTRARLSELVLQHLAGATRNDEVHALDLGQAGHDAEQMPR